LERNTLYHFSPKSEDVFQKNTTWNPRRSSKLMIINVSNLSKSFGRGFEKRTWRSAIC
jgi:hypothetical protein